MVVLGQWRGNSLTISIKPNSLTLSIQDATSSTVYSFDPAGRLWTAMRAGISYRRGLNGKVVAKWQTGGGNLISGLGRDRRWLAEPESAELSEAARIMAATLLADLHSGRVWLQSPLPADALPLLAAAGQYTPQAAEADLAHWAQVYKPIGILPPDQYMAVVLQLTEGCSFNTCTFCNFYRDRPFRIKPLAEFRQHAQAVKAFLGPGLALRRTIFLGDANALVVPMPRLLPLLDVVHEVYAVEELGGMYAFLDGFSGERKSTADWAELARRGLKRVYIGLESGSPQLLSFLKKPGRPEDALQAVQSMRAGGVSVGIIILLGAGGQQYAAGHVRDTVDLVNAMQLGMDDLIYFSELVESEGLEYTQDAYQAGLLPLSPTERIAQGQEIEAQLTFAADGGAPHISRYDIREFVY